MGLKYYTIRPQQEKETPNNQYTSDFQAWVDYEFYNAPDAYVIQEEVVFASGSYNDVEVRINRAINAYTGDKLGDDYKYIMFRDLQHSTRIGYKYKFDGNTWLVVNSETIKNFAASCTVRRCNNTLRWVDTNGNAYSEPCVFDYVISRPRDEVGTVNPVTPAGYVTIYVQQNDRTKTITGNKRFIVGPKNNRIAYKVFGDGVRNFLNQETDDDESSAMLVLTAGGNFVNEDTDDIITGYADIKTYDYQVSVDPTSITANVGETIQLNPEVTLNGYPIGKNVVYSCNSATVASVSGSGLVTMLTNGTCNVTCRMTENTSASAVIPVLVSASAVANYEIRVTPNKNYILQGENGQFEAKMYLNGAVLPDIFTFLVSGSTLIPAENYTFAVIDGNNFSVQNNKKYMDSPLYIDCTSGSFTKQLEITLKGAW
jgi:hypothetical protein